MIAWVVILSAAIGYGLRVCVEHWRAAQWTPREALPCVQNGERWERFGYRAQDAEGFLAERDALKRENAHLRERIRAHNIAEIEKRDERPLRRVEVAA